MAKLIYQPKGKAQEYGLWACNLYNGCSNRCEYCYNRHGLTAKVVGGDVPTLKKGLVSEEDVKKRFLRDYCLRADQIHTEGNELFFSFVSDPCLPETIDMTMLCVELALLKAIDARLLTKRKEIADWLLRDRPFSKTPQASYANLHCKERLRIGFTLTGRDDLEPGASTNRERIECIGRLAEHGFYTWASMEPIIDPDLTFQMFHDALGMGCREFRFGINSLRKDYTPSDIRRLKQRIDQFLKDLPQWYDLPYEPIIIWKKDTVAFMEKE